MEGKSQLLKVNRETMSSLIKKKTKLIIIPTEQGICENYMTIMYVVLNCILRNKLATPVLWRLRQGGITRLVLARIVQGVPVSEKQKEKLER